MLKKKGRLIGLGIALVAVVLLVWTATSERAIPAEIVMVSEDGLEVLVRGEGQTRVRDRDRVTAPVSGQLQAIQWQAGDSLQTGDILFTILPAPDSEQSRQVAHSRLEAARAQLTLMQGRRDEAAEVARQAERTLERQQALASEEILSPEEMERAELAAASARRNLDAAEAGVLAARADVRSAEALAIAGEDDRAASGIHVRASSSGHILRIPERSGRMVMAGESIMDTGQLDRLEIVLDVLSEDAVRIQAGNSVVFSGWGADDTATGQVRYVEPAAFTKLSALGVEEQRVNVVIDPDETIPGLGDGYRVDADIVVWSSPDALVVPVSSVFRFEGTWMAFLLDGDRIQRQAVEIGERSSERVEVLSGLEAGVEVIRYPTPDMDDGVLISR